MLCSVPFFVAAPVTTVDLDVADGSGIPIEQRGEEELTHFRGQRVAAEGIGVRCWPLSLPLNMPCGSRAGYVSPWQNGSRMQVAVLNDLLCREGDNGIRSSYETICRLTSCAHWRFAQVWNPSFDVTPASLLTGIITEHGVIQKRGQAFPVAEFLRTEVHAEVCAS